LNRTLVVKFDTTVRTVPQEKNTPLASSRDLDAQIPRRTSLIEHPRHFRTVHVAWYTWQGVVSGVDLAGVDERV
jgi:hypothetical protein